MTKYQREKQLFVDAAKKAGEEAEKKADSLIGGAIDSAETGPAVDGWLTKVKNSPYTAIAAGLTVGALLAGVFVAVSLISD